MRNFTVEVGGVAATFTLSDDAPETADAFWRSMPINGEVTHGRWAGSAVWVKTDRAPISELKDIELPVTSIYPGTIVVRPNPRGVAEVFISYGVAESRGPMGRTYATPVAEISGGEEEFYAALAKTWRGGSAPISITQSKEA